MTPEVLSITTVTVGVLVAITGFVATLRSGRVGDRPSGSSSRRVRRKTRTAAGSLLGVGLVAAAGAIAYDDANDRFTPLEAEGMAPNVPPSSDALPEADGSTAAALPRTAECSDVLFYDGFESGDASRAEGGFWETTSNPWGEGGFSADTVLRGDWARRGTYLPTPPGRDSDITFWASWPGNSAREVWIEWYLRIPENYEHRSQADQPPSSRPANNKFMIVGYSRQTLHGRWQDNGWHTRLEVERGPGGGSLSRSQPYLGRQGQHSASRQPFGQPWSFDVITAADRGTWMKVGAHVKLGSSIEAKDGIVEYWINDRLVVGSQSLELSVSRSDAPPPPIAAMELLGWANSGYTDTTNFYIDEVTVCGEALPWDTVTRGHSR